jgi:hypothetical protein
MALFGTEFIERRKVMAEWVTLAKLNRAAEEPESPSFGEERLVGVWERETEFGLEVCNTLLRKGRENRLEIGVFTPFDLLHEIGEGIA